MPISRNMKRLLDYARRNLDNVVIGVTAPFEAPKKGVGIEFTVQRESRRWGFRFRQEQNGECRLFFVTEQRPKLFHYGLRGNFGPNRSLHSKYVPHPLTLREIVNRWPPGYWLEGLTLLKRLERAGKR